MNDKNRRKSERTPFTASVKLWYGDEQVILEMRDLSAGGVYLYTGDHQPPPVGSQVKLQMQDLGDAPVVNAKIVRRDAKGIGLKFLV